MKEVLDMEAIITQTLTLFVVTALGFLAAKLGWLTKDVRNGMTSVLINIAAPCIILRSFQYESSAGVWHGMLVSAIVTGASILVGLGAGQIAFAKESPDKRAPLIFGTAFGNVGFMGIPVIGAFVGEAGLIYVSVAIATFNVFAWTLGIRLFDAKAFQPRKLLRFPCLYAVLAGLVMFAWQIPLPGLIDSVLQMVGSVNSPLAMMLVGAVIADSSLGAFFRDRGAMVAAFMRLVLFPAATLAACALFNISGMLRLVLVLLSGMPSAINTVLLALLFRGDEKAAGRVVGISTLFYLPAVFLWMLVLGG